MADVYKFRVTIDLEAATHEPPRVVRDHLRECAADAVRAYRERLERPPIGDDVLDSIERFNVRAKRLDDYAPIEPPVAVHLAGAKCPNCSGHFADVTINILPFHCPYCSRVVPIEAEGRVRP